MGVLISGEPVQWAWTSTGLSTVSPISIFYPGTSVIRPLLSTEQFTFMALRGIVQGNTFITKAPSTATSTSAIAASTVLLAFALDDTTWHDDDTGAMSGLVGVIPCVVQLTTGVTFLSGTGLITQPIMGPVRNPQFALLSNNSNAAT